MEYGPTDKCWVGSMDLRTSVRLEYGPIDECWVGVRTYGRVSGWTKDLQTRGGLEHTFKQMGY